jgi:hypothetical protein
MSDISNCSRVDAVKALASQLKMQLAQAPQSIPASESYRKAQGRLEALEKEIRTGDAQKAETALSNATIAVEQLQSQATTPAESGSGLDTYA